MTDRDIFTPPKWSPPSTDSSPRVTKLSSVRDWSDIAARELAAHGDRLVWIARVSRSGSESGPETFTYRVITRPTHNARPRKRPTATA